MGTLEELLKVSNTSLSLKGIALVWWHHKFGDVKKGFNPLRWDDSRGN